MNSGFLPSGLYGLGHAHRRSGACPQVVWVPASKGQSWNGTQFGLSEDSSVCSRQRGLWHVHCWSQRVALVCNASSSRLEAQYALRQPWWPLPLPTILTPSA